METFKNFGIKGIGKLSRFFQTDMMYVVKGGLWMNANFIVISLFALGISIIFGHFVPKETYGTYQFILAMATTIAVFVPNSMSGAVLQSVARGNEGDLVAGTKFQIKWGFIGSLISVGVSLWYLLHGNMLFSLVFIVIAIFMPATYALNTWNAYVQAKKDYKRYFLYNSLVAFISYGGIMATIFISKNFFYLAVANILFAFIANLTAYFLTIKKMRPGNQTDPETIQFGKHLSIMGIPQGLTSQLDALLVFHFLGAVPLAVYSFATIFPERLSGALKLMSLIIAPKFSEKSEADVQGFFKKKFWWILAFLAIIVITYALLSPLAFKIFFPQYLDAIPYTQVYSLSFFSIAAGLGGAALMSQKRTKDLYISSLATPIFRTILMMTLLFFFGIWGLIWAQIATIFFQMFFPIYLFKRSRVESIEGI